MTYDAGYPCCDAFVRMEKEIEHLRALVDDVSDWQPIKTYHLNQPVLIAGGDIIYPIVASWNGRVDECWHIDAQENLGDEVGWPTHWMPLPAPPKTDS